MLISEDGNKLLAFSFNFFSLASRATSIFILAKAWEIASFNVPKDGKALPAFIDPANKIVLFRIFSIFSLEKLHVFKCSIMDFSCSEGAVEVLCLRSGVEKVFLIA